MYVEERTFPKCVEFLREIKETCYDQILTVYTEEKYKPVKERDLIEFVSDEFENYRSAFNKLFYRTCKLRFGVPIACRQYGLEHNNNPIERYNGDVEDRTKTMRDFGSHEGAESFLNMKRTIHNFVNPHMSLNEKTPAEAAGIVLKLGRTKLFSLVKMQAQKRHHSLR